MKHIDTLEYLSEAMTQRIYVSEHLDDSIEEHLTPKDAQNLKSAIHTELQIYAQCIATGKEFFVLYGDIKKIAPIFKKIENSISTLADHPSKVKKMQLLSSKEYFELFDIAFSVYEKEKLEAASYMLSVLTLIDPLFVQPYILLGTIVWRQKNAKEACKIYKNFTQMLQDPLLYLYAADCFYHAGDADSASKYLKAASELCKGLDSKESSDLLQDIKAYKKKLGK